MLKKIFRFVVLGMISICIGNSFSIAADAMPIITTYPLCECATLCVKSCSEHAVQTQENFGMDRCEKGYGELNLKIISLIEKKGFFLDKTDEEITIVKEKLMKIRDDLLEKEPDLNNMYANKDMTKSPYFIRYYVVQLLIWYIDDEVLQTNQHCTTS